jgi:hypothetical protein
MSQLQVNRINDASGGVLAPISSVMRNRIINGAMVIDQRNAGASVTNDAAQLNYPVDRTAIYGSVSSKFTAQQNAGSVTPPVGFTNYLGCTSSSAYTVGASEFFTVSQYIEGYNVADLNWGTANAKTVTLSFWVRSSLTGNFGGSLQNSAINRSYPFSYTISAANTWEYKTITVAGDTSGTWVGATNGVGLRIWLGLGVGSTYSGTAGAWSGSDFRSATGATSVVGTNGATFFLTGVQLEVGTQATSFEYRMYSTELNNCQRYCRTLTSDSGNDKAVFSGICFTTGTAIYSYTFPTMRVAPTATITNSTSVDIVLGNSVSQINNTLAFSEFTPNSCQPSSTNSGLGYVPGHGAVLRFDGAFVVFSAEL